MIPDFIKSINNELKNSVDQDYRNTIRDHFHMDVDHFLGVRTPVLRQIATRNFQKDKNTDETLAMCDELLATGVYEHKIVAFFWAHKCKRNYHPEHFVIFQRWLAVYVDDWIDCDTLCISVLGEFLVLYPEFQDTITEWAYSENKWFRRGAAVSLIFGLRRAMFITAAFNVANRLLLDREDIVLKASGWMLKEASKSFQEDVFDYLMSQKEIMPRVTLRCAAEKMPPKMRTEVMKR